MKGRSHANRAASERVGQREYPKVARRCRSDHNTLVHVSGLKTIGRGPAKVPERVPDPKLAPSRGGVVGVDKASEQRVLEAPYFIRLHRGEAGFLDPWVRVIPVTGSPQHALHKTMDTPRGGTVI